MDAAFMGRDLPNTELYNAEKSVTYSPGLRFKHLLSLHEIYVFVPASVNQFTSNTCKYSITPIIRIYWDGEPSGYAENPDNWIFF
jgi:hypothetical protein